MQTALFSGADYLLQTLVTTIVGGITMEARRECQVIGTHAFPNTVCKYSTLRRRPPFRGYAGVLRLAMGAARRFERRGLPTHACDLCAEVGGLALRVIRIRSDLV